ncbi:MAG: FAD-dependent oxidoreductase [Dehalococcoidia bacterium]|nr:MAG: FAD-dependent oxidoreductase [Dehalococcoidia bacterium]
MEGINKLFEEGRIGKLSIQNRIVMAPMGIVGLTEPNGMITQRGIDYYIERAKGGVGLIITRLFLPILDIEFGPLKELGISPVPRIERPDVLPRLEELAVGVHKYETRIAIQLTAGFGRVLDPHIVGALGIETTGPSPIPNVWDLGVITRELSTEEVELIVKACGTAAEMIKAAGIDAIELHGHEGYLLDQFMTSLWNKRTDKYGGELSGRLRFPLEMVEMIKEKAGEDFPVIYRYAIDHYIEGGRQVPESLEIARRLEKAGVDALHVDAGCYDNWYWPHPPLYQPPGGMVHVAEVVKQAVSIPVITVGRLGYSDLAERVLREGKADFIALGRPLLADPEWPLKAKEGRKEDIRPCIGCHNGCLGRIVHVHPLSCAVNPATGNERELEILPAERKKSVLVIGGGIAGMEAARVAALRGHSVTLYEKRDQLGGHLVEGSVPEFKNDVRLLIEYYLTQLKKLNVKIELNKEAIPELMQKIECEVMVVATGSMPVVPDIPGIEKDTVVSAIDVLAGGGQVGEDVLVTGGGLVGCEVAVYLAQKGRRVTVVEMQGEILPRVFEANKQYLHKMLTENGVRVLTNTALARITDEGAILVNKIHRYEAEVAADTVVLAVGLKPRDDVVRHLECRAVELYHVGDCREPGRIMDAIWGAFETLRTV